MRHSTATCLLLNQAVTTNLLGPVGRCSETNKCMRRQGAAACPRATTPDSHLTKKFLRCSVFNVVRARVHAQAACVQKKQRATMTATKSDTPGVSRGTYQQNKTPTHSHVHRVLHSHQPSTRQIAQRRTSSC